MKKLLSILAVFILLVSGTFTAFSAEKVAFSVEDTSTKNNRIFTLTVSAKGNESLSAVRLDFTYNSDFIEFRQVKATDENTKIKTREENDRLRLIFLNEKGIDLQEGAELFTIDFKGENLTVDEKIYFEASDCVNNKVENVAATGGSATVSLIEKELASTNSEKTTTASDKTLSFAKSKTVANENAESEETQAPPQSNNEAIQSDEEINSPEQSQKVLIVGERDNTLQVFAAGAVMMLVLISVCVVSYHIGRKSKEKDEK